jgi:hypothetical protein
MRRIRSILATTVLAFYGASSLLGPALHSVTGFSHATSGAARSLPQVVAAGSHANAASSADHCPICHFIAQSQLLSGFSVASHEFQSPQPNEWVALEVTAAERYQPANPRAPPFASAHIQAS